MNKKTSIIVSVIIILIAVASYWAYKDFSAFKPENIGAEDTSQTMGGINYEIVEVDSDTNVSAEANIQFKKTALEIASMP